MFSGHLPEDAERRADELLGKRPAYRVVRDKTLEVQAMRYNAVTQNFIDAPEREDERNPVLRELIMSMPPETRILILANYLVRGGADTFHAIITETDAKKRQDIHFTIKRGLASFSHAHMKVLPPGHNWLREGIECHKCTYLMAVCFSKTTLRDFLDEPMCYWCRLDDVKYYKVKPYGSLHPGARIFGMTGHATERMTLYEVASDRVSLYQNAPVIKAPMNTVFNKLCPYKLMGEGCPNDDKKLKTRCALVGQVS